MTYSSIGPSAPNGFQRLLQEMRKDLSLRRRVFEDPSWAADEFELTVHDMYRLERFLDYRDQSDQSDQLIETTLMKVPHPFSDLDNAEIREWGACLSLYSRGVTVHWSRERMQLLREFQRELLARHESQSSRDRLRNRIVLGHVSYLLGEGDPVYFEVPSPEDDPPRK